jgi:hypothetical protein
MIYATAGKYNSEVPVLRLALTAVLVGVTAAAAQVGSSWRDAPEYVPLLAPVGGRDTAYRFYTSTADLDSALRLLQQDPTLTREPGSWEPSPTLPLDVFGQAGRYDRSAMARVYGARQPRVARGARMVSGRVVESWTLVSPFPDSGLTRLETGTLLIVLRLP